MNKLKAVARSVSFSTKSSSSARNNRHEKDKIEPVVGFQVTLYDAANVATDGETPIVSPCRRILSQNISSSTAWRAFDRRQALALKFWIENSRRLHCQGWKMITSLFIQRSIAWLNIFQVKLFPGSAKYDSSIQTSSWPKFGETFRFPMAPLHKWVTMKFSCHGCLSYRLHFHCQIVTEIEAAR